MDTTKWVRLNGKKLEGFAIRGKNTQVDFVIAKPEGAPEDHRDFLHALLYIPRFSTTTPETCFTLSENGLLEYPGGSVSFLTEKEFSAAFFAVKEDDKVVDFVIAYRVRSALGMADMLSRLREIDSNAPEIDLLIRRVQENEDPLLAATRH